MTNKPMNYGYLHGFASSRDSRKGVHMARAFKARGLHLERAELNVPSFAELTFSGALSVIDAMDAAAPPARWCLFGSSMGGYLATRWAELHPDRVERLVLMCPGFDLIGRWPDIVGHENMALWSAQGFLLWPDAQGVQTPLHWEFVEDCRRHPSWPEAPCPTLIIHGRQDETVSIESSRQYALARPHVALIEVDDDHSLAASLPLIERESMKFLGIEG